MLNTLKLTPQKREEFYETYLEFYPQDPAAVLKDAHERLGPVFTVSLRWYLQNVSIDLAFKKALKRALQDNTPALVETEAKMLDFRPTKDKSPRNSKFIEPASPGVKLAGRFNPWKTKAKKHSLKKAA